MENFPPTAGDRPRLRVRLVYAALAAAVLIVLIVGALFFATSSSPPDAASEVTALPPTSGGSAPAPTAGEPSEALPPDASTGTDASSGEPPGEESALPGSPSDSDGIAEPSGVQPQPVPPLPPAPGTQGATPSPGPDASAEAEARYQEELKRRFEEELARYRQQQMEAAGASEEQAALPEAPPAAEERIVRYPTLDAPEQAVSGEEFTVTVALTEEQLTPDVTVKPGPGSTVTEEGALELALPAGEQQWPIDVDLLAAGFDLADGGAWSRRINLFREGDSDFARFTLKARSIAGASKPRRLIARLYHQGAFLGSVSRPITVLGTQATETAEGGNAPASAPVTLASLPEDSQPLTSEISVGAEAEDVPDLDVTIHYADPDRLGDGLIIIHSPHIGAPVSAEFSTPEGADDWLNAEYRRLVDLGLKLRGAEPLGSGATARDPQEQKRFVAKVAEGFGSDLYRNYVPDAFKQVFWSLKGQDRLHSIQITSNSPVLPWELVLPMAADGKPDGFLGINYRLARWAPRSTAGQVDRPLDSLAFTGVATVAPAYRDRRELPFQKVEVEALSKLDGFRLVDGDFGSFEKLVGEVSTGFIHFSGHGAVNDPGSGSPVFAIQLLDQALDPTTWRALTFAPHDKGNPFFFFNACDTGRARSLGGFVQGWGPAILASGAAGFIGGMWPLTDRAAASFSTGFYGEVSVRLKTGPVYLAEVLQDVRRQFYETGDPTYLAYTFYGNANLRVVRR